MAAPRARRTRPRRFRHLASSTLLALSSIVASPSSSVAAPVFADGFESGNFLNWTSVSGVTVQRATVHTGSWAARAAGNGTTAFAYRAFPTTYPALFARISFQVVSRSTNAWVESLRQPNGATIASVGMNTGGKLIVRNAITGVTHVSSIIVTNGVWHEVELRVMVGSSGRFDVWYDGTLVSALSRSDNLGTTQIGRVLIGENSTGRNYDIAIDDLNVATQQGPPDVEPPTVPTGLSATPRSSSRIDLTWQPAMDDVGVAGYTVYRSTDGTTFGEVDLVGAAAFTDSGLAAETTYWYQVDAFDAAGNHSGESMPAEAITLPQGSTPPSIVLILTDDQPADTIDRMPILQAELVGKGVDFTSAIASNPLCCPSRASIQRGQYSHTTGLYDNGPPNGGYDSFRDFGLIRSTIATWLDSAGYRTGFLGKFMNRYAIQDEPVGWDYWRGTTAGYFGYRVNEDGVVRTVGTAEADYHTKVLAGYADTFIRSTDPDTPLFLQVDPYAPHHPYTPEGRYANDARCATATNTDSPAYNEADVSDKPTYIRTRNTVGTQAGIDNPRAQCRTLLSVDDLLGTVLDALGDTGRLGSTMIIYTADNGHMNGEHRWGTKWVPYEGSIRVPLVVRYDPMTGGGGRVDGHLVANIDIAPTLVDFAGISVTPGCPTPFFGGVCTGLFDGRSFLPILDGTITSWRQDVLIEQKSDASASFFVPPYCGVRSATHKFVRYTTGEEELYDLVNDPWELVNMLGDGAVTPQDQALRDQMFARLFGSGGLCSPPPPTYAPP